MSTNPYQILHLQQDATYDDIKERYRHLTKCLHPDKQPLQNYQATKKLFQQIDQAYKSISSPLRRYLFREYGLPALKILDQAPEYFQEFDLEQFTPEQIKKLKQLMIYLLYERQATYQTDKTKFITRMVINITKTIKGKPKNAKKSSKRNYHIPEIENCTFEYQMVLPQLLSFANTFAISQTTSNLKTNPKSSLNFVFSSARRIFWNYMLALQFNISSQQSNLALGINKLCQNNLSLNFTPIFISNWKFSTPKVTLEKSFQQYQISSTIDLNGDISIDYSDSSQKKIGKSLKLYMEKESLGLIPRIQIQMTEILRFFTQVSIAVQSHGKDGINLRPALTYGYKLVINQQLKIQLASCIGSNNYLQLSFISGKFRVGIPFIVNDVDLIQFQILKVTTMALVYLCLQGYKYKAKRNKKQKQKELRQNQTRLNQLRRELNRNLSDIQLTAQIKRQKEIKYNGLIIVRAIFGENAKVQSIAKKLQSLKINLEKSDSFARQIADLQEQILGLNINMGEINDEVENITTLMQNQVIGGQIINYDLNQLKKYSPIIEPNQIPTISLLYIQRGKLKNVTYKCNKTINLGTKYHGFNIKKTIQYLIGYFM